MTEFRSILPASGAVDHFPGYAWGVELDAPFFSGDFPEIVIIGDGGLPGIAFRTVDAAASD